MTCERIREFNRNKSKVSPHFGLGPEQVSYNMNDQEKTTDIGVLEWNLETRTILHQHLELIRPTTKEDLEHKRIAAAQHPISIMNSEDSWNAYVKESMIYTAIHTIHVAHREDIEEGPILLCFTQKQLRWSYTIHCDLRKVEP
jgi:hypothetical protein